MKSRLKDNLGEYFTLSVDGVGFIVPKPAPYVKAISNIWYSKKSSGPSLWYEIGVGIIDT